MSRRTLWIGLAVVVGAILLLSVVVRTVSRPLIDTHNLIFDDAYTMTVPTESDLVVIGDSILINDTVNGDASFVGDAVTITGNVNGDLAIAAPSILLDNATISGDAVLMGDAITISGEIGGDLTLRASTLDIADGTTISGAVSACADKIQDQRGGETLPCDGSFIEPILVNLIALRAGELVLTTPSPVEVLVGGLLFSGVMAGLASLCVTIFPRQISRIEEAIRSNPRHLGGVGIATFALSIGVSVALIWLLAQLPPIGVLLIPVYLIAGVGLLVLVMVGWVTLSLVIGDALARRIAQSRSAARRVYPPLITAALGSVVLSMAFTLLSLLPFGGVLTMLLALAVLSTGVGAGLFTRLGTRTFNRSTFVQG